VAFCARKQAAFLLKNCCKLTASKGLAGYETKLLVPLLFGGKDIIE
jgi:hypothetical protein